jgi:chemotaxis protein methyltransferase CheR
MTVARILADPDYADLKRYILEHTGLDYYLDKDEDLASRLGRRLAAQHMEELRSYRRLLEPPRAGASEMDGLVGELTIGETYFFRQREHFDFLRDRIFPELLERNGASRSIRVWSAGCATGAEPYSVAMLLRLDLAPRVEGWDIPILGTDINVEFLARARQARYDHWAFREVPEHLKARCFRKDGRQWVLRPEFREGVSFEYHNLASGPPSPNGARFDVILCRNVTIYFGPAMVRRVVANFHEALAEGGWLLVGHAEPNAETFARFTTVSESGTTAYRKLPPPPRIAPSEVAPYPVPLPKLPPRRARPAAARPPFAPVAPPDPVATVDDARALADRGEWSAAAALCRRLIASDSLNAAAHFTLGLILEHERAMPEAERCLRRAIYLNRAFALAHYHLGICLQQGSPAQAGKAFENVLRLLHGRAPDEVVEHGDGITVNELKDLAKMHLEVLGGT